MTLQTCYTEPQDFGPDSMQGHWDDTLSDIYDDDGNFIDTSPTGLQELSDEGDAYHPHFGNLQCPMELYFWSCGAGLGRNSFNHTDVFMESNRGEGRAIEGDRRGDWKSVWNELGRQARKHQSWIAKDCAMPTFDGEGLATALAGGRKLVMAGDSTMRGMFIAVTVPYHDHAGYLPTYLPIY